MTDNSTSPARAPKSPDRMRLWLLAWKIRVGSYRLLASQLGINNPSYLSGFVKHGTVPGNREIQDRMFLIDNGLEYTRTRIERLNSAAVNAGWKHLSEYLTAVHNDVADIPQKGRQ